MKKLGKLTLNEMQEYAPLSPQEQMGMKGGGTGGLWLRLIPVAWELAEKIYEYIQGSQGSGCNCPSDSVSIHEAKVVKLADGTEIIGSQLICIPQ